MSELEKGIDGDAPREIRSALRELGVTHITLNLAGYRSGNMNLDELP